MTVPRGDNGGPKTPEGRATALANLQPETAPLKHGVHRWLSRGLAPPCNRCVARERCESFATGENCKLAEDYCEEVITEVMALPQIRPHHRHLVLQYAKALVGVAIIDLWLSVVGPFKVNAETLRVEGQPVLDRTRAALMNAATRLAAELGLTPAAEVRLKQGGDDAARRLVEVFAEVAREKREAVGEGETE